MFEFHQVRTGRSRGHISRHLTEGYIDLALLVYDNENDEQAKLVGEGPATHHFSVEVDNRQGFIEKIEANGGSYSQSRIRARSSSARLTAQSPRLSMSGATRR